MAAKSIIDVDVKDEAFKAFLDLFNQYKAAVGEMPEEWAKTGDSVQEIADDFSAMVGAMRKQQELLEQQAKTKAEMARAEREDLKNAREQQKELARGEQDRARTVRQIYDDAKGIARSVADTTMHIVSWVGLGGILGGLIGAGGLWGLDTLADRAGDARRAASGLGVTPGQQQALGLNFQRYFDVNTNLENIADARANYANRWAFSAMGINPEGQDNATLSANMAIRAKEIFDRGDQSQQYAQSQGLLQFYSMDELRRLHSISMEELRAAASSYRRDAGALGMGDATYRQWQEFSVQMQRAQRSIENAFITGLQPLTPALTRLSAAVAETISSFLARPELKQWISGLADGVKGFADYLTSPEFKSDLDTFWDGIKSFAHEVTDIVRALHDAGVKLGLISEDRSDERRTPEQEAADLARSRTFTDAIIRGANEQAPAVDYFTRSGWTRDQSAGIVANLYAESGMNPFARGDVDPRTGKAQAYGLGQWHPDRQAEYLRLFGHTMQSVTDRQQAITEQLQFVQYELTRGQEQGAGNMLRGAQNSRQAGAIVSRYYERPANADAEAARRGAGAQGLVTIIIRNQTGAQVSTTGAQVAGGQ